MVLMKSSSTDNLIQSPMNHFCCSNVTIRTLISSVFYFYLPKVWTWTSIRELHEIRTYTTRVPFLFHIAWTWLFPKIFERRRAFVRMLLGQSRMYIVLSIAAVREERNFRHWSGSLAVWGYLLRCGSFQCHKMFVPRRGPRLWSTSITRVSAKCEYPVRRTVPILGGQWIYVYSIACWLDMCRAWFTI